MPIELDFLPIIANKTTKRRFIKWLYDSGWIPYDSVEVWINFRAGNKTMHIRALYQRFVQDHEC